MRESKALLVHGRLGNNKILFPAAAFSAFSSSADSISNSNSCDDFAPLLSACTDISALRRLHALILRGGHSNNVFLSTRILALYAQNGRLDDAERVFKKVAVKNVFVWNEMIKAYACSDTYPQMALSLYHQMLAQGTPPNRFTLPFVLKACAATCDVEEGREIHNLILSRGFLWQSHVMNALLDMYVKCGFLETARQVFDEMPSKNVVSWTTIIAGYVKNGIAEEALSMFQNMLSSGVAPNRVTMLLLLEPCALGCDLASGMSIHEYMIVHRIEFEESIATALIRTYAQCGSIDNARKIFERMRGTDPIFWSAMIHAYAQAGHATEALGLFGEMQRSGVDVGSFAMVSALQACAQAGDFRRGTSVHRKALHSGLQCNVFVGTGLVDMYAKCGKLEMARRAFDEMPEKNVVAWTAMIAGFGMHGRGNDALQFYRQMREANVRPNPITFTSVLSACSHAGLVDEACNCFYEMIEEDRIEPRLEHYNCMVDVLGRAGMLEKAWRLIEQMHVSPDMAVWAAFLGACRLHCNVQLGKNAARVLFQHTPANASCYVLSNIYAQALRLSELGRVRSS